MRTPWSDLLKYGAGIAVMIVMAISVMGLLLVVALGVVAAKISVLIR